MHSEFAGFAYYVAAWGGLLLLALCGVWFLIGMSGAKWVLRVAAVIVALFVVLIGLIAWSNAPFYGGHDVVFYVYLVLAVAFCAVTYFIAGRRGAQPIGQHGRPPAALRARRAAG
jgi:hypothetical protein